MADSEANKRPQFEYKWIDVLGAGVSFEDFKKLLADCGMFGWELCGFEYGHAVLKRNLDWTAGA